MSNENTLAEANEVRVPATAASAAGFHFFQLYQCCPRKFFLKYAVGLTTKYTPTALTFGAAFHEGKATFYTTQSLEMALEVGTKMIEDAKHLYEEEEKYEKDLYRLPILLRNWIVTFGLNDLIKYEVFAVEQELQVTLSNGFTYTGRPDTILKDKSTGELFIMETKTSGFSKDLTMDGVFYGDQVTSYLALTRVGAKLNTVGVIADVAYWNKNAKYETNIECLRSEVLTRTDEDIQVLLGSVAQVYSEISQKVEAVKQGADERMLFSRNTYYCNGFGKMCEFADVCKLRIKPGDSAPIGFVIEDTADDGGSQRGKGLSGMVADSIAVE